MQLSKTRPVYTYIMKKGHEVRGRYYGGTYIDIVLDGKTVDVINVWDYENDTATIKCTPGQVTKQIIQWAADDAQFDCFVKEWEYIPG